MSTEKVKVARLKRGSHSVNRAATEAVHLEVECPIGKQEAAKILGVSTDTLDQWTAKLGIPHYKYDVAGNTGNWGKVVYLATELLAFREQFKVAGEDIGRAVEDFMAQADRAGRSGK